jgi:hypothetical protein
MDTIYSYSYVGFEILTVVLSSGMKGRVVCSKSSMFLAWRILRPSTWGRHVAP